MEGHDWVSDGGGTSDDGGTRHMIWPRPGDFLPDARARAAAKAASFAQVYGRSVRGALSAPSIDYTSMELRILDSIGSLKPPVWKCLRCGARVQGGGRPPASDRPKSSFVRTGRSVIPVPGTQVIPDCDVVQVLAVLSS